MRCEKLRKSLDREKHIILTMLHSCRSVLPSAEILDVGCGFGRNLQNLKESGFRAVGVDTNPEMVAANRKRNFECYLPSENEWRRQYDVLLLSHIIEHFSPEALLPFMEEYLKYLKVGGVLLVATPLLTDYFYDDFTHVRPYLPESLLAVFSPKASQMSLQSSTHLELVDLWFRTSPIRLRRLKARYIGRPGRTMITSLNASFIFLHAITFGLVGIKDGWVGLFRKIT